MTNRPTASEIIDALGGTTKVARFCEIKPPSVSEWRLNGIPKSQLRSLRLAYPEVFATLEGASSSGAGAAEAID